MSDRPNDSTPGGAVRRSGWRTPDPRTPSPDRPAPAPVTEETRTWRDVPLSAFDAQPRTRGGWHLPKPEQTTYAPPADEDAIRAALAADPPPAAPIAEAVDLLPFDDSTPVQVIPPAEEGEQPAPALEAASDALIALDDEEEDSGAPSESFSMSELIALATLADAATSAPSSASASATFDPAAFDPSDPVSYARRQMELLQQQTGQGIADDPFEGGTATITPTDSNPPIAPTGEMGVADPAEYARQQLAALQGGASAPAAPALTPEERALAQRYHDAEARIADLRRMYQGGQITREAFEQGLRASMVLDDDRVYWMLGTESDRWYKYENDQWLPANPPVLDKEAALSRPTGLDAGATVPTQTIGDAWVPARVPVSDPEATIPGTGGIFLETDQATVPARPVDFGATIPSPSYTDPTVPMGTFNQTVPSPAVASPVIAPANQGGADAAAVESALFEDAVQRQRQNTARTIVIAAAVIVGALFLVGTLVVVAAVSAYNNIADPYRAAIAALENYQPQFQTARILAADGSLIAELTSTQGGARTRIPLSRMSPEIIHAIVSVENERFFQDPGFDVFAIARAFLQNLTAGEIESGASTITQQIARNLVLQDASLTADRKLREIVIAAEIARRYDKNFILELYMNEIFFGNQSYGIEAAAQFYFRIPAQELNLAQSAMIAGLIQAPARFDPVINRQAAFVRMNEVLNKQAQVGCLQFQHAPYDNQPFCVTQAQVTSPQVVLQKARVETAQYLPRQVQIRYPHFVNYIQQQIELSFGTSEMFRRGFVIRTTLVPRLQDAAISALQQGINGLAVNGINTGAIMVSNPVDGAILAMVGSPNFNDETIDGQVNNVFTYQQPGSAIKPAVYAAALEGVDRADGRAYLTAASILWDVPTTFDNPPYSPINFDRRFRGPVALRSALANSYNVPAVKALAFTGTDRFRETAERMGIRFLPDATFGLPSALGANDVRLYDMMALYATIANNGLRAQQYAITAITTSEGQALTLPARPAPVQVIQPQVAFLLQNILSDNAARTPAFGANSPLVINGFDGRVGAKTGTTNDNRDLWTMGFSRTLVTGVWIGRHDNGPTVNTSGLAAAPIWNAVMSAGLAGTNPAGFNAPQGIVQQQVCVETGTVYDPNNVTPGCRSVRTEFFIASAPPEPATQSFVQEISIDSWSGLRANQFCPDNTINGTFANISDPSAVAWLNTPEGRAYAQSIGLPAQLNAPPTAQCDQSTVTPQVRFTNISEGQALTGQVDVQVIVTGPGFQSFRLEVAPSTAPDRWEVIAGPFGAQQPGGSIGIWDTTRYSNGAYRLRLIAQSTTGGFAQRIISVGLNNLPTPTPTVPLPTISIPTLDPNVTALPFPTPIPFDGGAGAQIAPTFTPGFVPMGGLSVQPPTPTIFQN